MNTNKATKKITTLLSLLLITSACSFQAAQSEKIGPLPHSITIVFKDAVNTHKRGTYFQSGMKPISYLGERNTENFDPKTPGYDTLTIPSHGLLTEVCYHFLAIEIGYFPLIAGDTVLCSYDSTGYPAISSLVNPQYTRYYNTLAATPGFRLPCGYRTYAALTNWEFIDYQKAIRENNKGKIGYYNEFFNMDQYHVDSDSIKQQREAFLKKLAPRLDSLQKGDTVALAFYNYFKTQMDIENQLIQWAQMTDAFAQCTSNPEIMQIKINMARPLLNDQTLNTNRSLYYDLLRNIRDPWFVKDQADKSNESVAMIEPIRQTKELPVKTKNKMLMLAISEKISNTPADSVIKYLEYYIHVSGDTLPRADLELFKSSVQNFKDDLSLTALNGDTLLLQNLLDQHKGKVIYIDFWASWCAPCRLEMPKAKALRQEYKNKDVVFIYLALNDQTEKWKAAVKAEQTDDRGLNYIINNPKAARFLVQQKVERIPRFMIYNTNGKLVEANAPRPGTKEIRQLLDKYLKQ